MRKGCLLRFSSPIAVTLLSVLPAGTARGQMVRFPVSSLRLGPPLEIGQTLQLGEIVDAVVRTDGSVCFLEMEEPHVTCLSDAGTLLWRTGRRGRGPGEFQLPYKIALGDNDQILVYDAATSEVSSISPSGAYQSRTKLEFMFRQVNGLLVLPGGLLAIAGYSENRGQASDSAIHIFGTAGDHLRSFGPLPLTTKPNVLPYWGAGPLTLGFDGQIIYVRRLPYEVYFYSTAGRLEHVLRPKVKADASADDTFLTEKQVARTYVRVSPKPVLAPGAFLPIARSLALGQRYLTENGKISQTWWDLFEADEVVGSVQLDANKYRGALLLGRDPRGRYLWVAGLNDGDIPVLWRMSFNAGQRP